MKKEITMLRVQLEKQCHFRVLMVLLAVSVCSFSFSQSWVQLKDIGANVSGTASASPPVQNALSLSANGKIFVIGNITFTGSTTSAVLWEYNPAGDTWTEKSVYPGTGTSYICGFTIGNFLYVGCGLGGTLQATSDFFRYNIITNSWTAITNIPVPRIMGTGFAIGSKGYITGGESNTMGSYLGDFWEYDTTSNIWTQKANFPDTARALSLSFSAGGFGFVGLGYYNNKWLNDFYKYNPATDSWSAISSFPGQGRCGAGVIVRGNHAVIICGNKGMSVFNDCYSYNTVANTWSNFSSFTGAARTMMICGIAGDQLYAGGGTGSGGASPIKDWWSLQTPLGLNNNFLEKGQVFVFQNALNETILRSNTELTIGKPFRVLDAQGRLVNSGTVLGTETNLQVNIPGVYMIVIGSDVTHALKFGMN